MLIVIKIKKNENRKEIKNNLKGCLVHQTWRVVFNAAIPKIHKNQLGKKISKLQFQNWNIPIRNRNANLANNSVQLYQHNTATELVTNISTKSL